MLFKPLFLLSVLALIEAAIINRNTISIAVRDDGKDITDSVASAFALTDAANPASVVVSEDQSTVDSVKAVFALTDAADAVAGGSVAGGGGETQETTDAVTSAFALTNAAGAVNVSARDTTNTTTNNATKAMFDGRIKSSAPMTSFDKDISPYKKDNVKGAGLNFSNHIFFPNVSNQSLFDRKTNTKAFEVIINDTSIFNNQTGFRRIGLLPSANSTANNITTTGIKTVHFSFQTNPGRALNLSHEYQIGWLESADFSTNQFAVKVGTLLGQEKNGGKNITVQSNQNGKPNNGTVQTLFTTPLTDNVWHNLAFTMDFGNNTIQTYYSQNSDALVAQGTAVPNDMSGDGEYQFGILKKPTDSAKGADITKNGFQEKGINEGIIFGGVFLEDSKGGVVTLS